MDPTPHLHWTEGTLLEAQTLAHVGVWEWRVDSGQVHWSPELYRMYGFAADAGRTPEQDLQRVAATVVRQDWPVLAAARDAALTRGASFDFEFRIIREDGERRTLHAVGRVYADPQTGKTTRILGTTQDITRRQSAEAALGESEKRFRAAFDDAPIGMALVGLDGRVLRVNRAAAVIFGRPVAELMRMDVQQLTHKEDLFAARLGGDEFALLLAHVDLETATAVAELLADSVAEAAGYGVSCSVGVARIGSGEGAPAAMRIADRRMYERKHARRPRLTA